MEKKELNHLRLSKKVTTKVARKNKSTRIVNFKYLLVLVSLGSFLMVATWEIIEYINYDFFLEVESFFRGLLIGFISSLIYGLYMMLLGLIKKLNTENKVWLAASLIFLIVMASCIIWELMTSDDTSEVFILFYISLAFLLIPKLAFIIKNYWERGARLNVTIIGLLSTILVFALIYVINTPLTQAQAIKCVNENTIDFSDLPLRFQEDKEVVMKAVQQNGLALEYVSYDLKDDKKIVMKAVQQNGLALKYVSYDLKDDKKIVIKAVQQNGLALKHVSYDLKDDKKIVMEAVQQNGLALEYADNNLQYDKEIVMEAVQQNGLALEYADYYLQYDKEIVMEAVQQNGLALEYADYYYDKKIVMEAVQQNGLALEYSSSLYGKEIVMEAVQQNGLALEYASDDLKNDKDIVLAAVKKHGQALHYASDALKNDSEILNSMKK